MKTSNKRRVYEYVDDGSLSWDIFQKSMENIIRVVKA